MHYQIPFSRNEYESRVRKVQGMMRERGFAALICQDPANMCWMTGFDNWSFYTPQAVLLGVDDAWPTWFGRPQDAKAARMTTVLPEANVLSFSESLVHHPDKHPYDELCALLRDRGFAKARIAVEMDAHYYTARAHRHLVEGLPQAAFLDSRELVNWAKSVKSDAELALMRQAGRICTQTMNAAIAKMAPGVRQSEIVAEVYARQTLGIDGLSGDYTSLCPLIQVGEGTSTPHLTWSEAPLPDNTLIVMEIAGARRHYTAPLSRTIHLGKPPQKIADLARVIVEGVDAALEAARPGATCEEVETVWQKVLKRNGIEKKSRVGYSIGLAFPPDWGERTMSLRPGDTTVLEAGMCFHFQSGVWLANYGAAISEPFAVSDRGGERLTDVDRRLIEIA
jgi:Xaa-Pro aminopeptidase